MMAPVNARGVHVGTRMRHESNFVRLPLNSNLYDLICSFGISGRVFRQKPSFDRLANVYTHFVDRLTLRHATG